MINVGSLVKINPRVLQNPNDNLGYISHKVYKVFSFDNDLVNIECIDQTIIRTIVLGMNIQDLIAVSVHNQFG